MYLKFDHMHINSIKENLFALGLLHLAKYWGVDRNLKIHKPSQVCLQTSSYPDNLGDIASLIQANPKLIFCFETIIILNPYNAIGKRI